MLVGYLVWPQLPGLAGDIGRLPLTWLRLAAA
jgi:hypothetical protein